MSTPKHYRKKPVEVEAVRLTPENGPRVCRWCGGNPVFMLNTKKIVHIEIKTFEGTMTANLGDFIVKGVAGEFYPCKPQIFEKTYEEVTE